MPRSGFAPPAPDEVRVWIARVGEHAPRTAALAALLDRREAEMAARFRFASDRIRYVVAHGLLRLVLGAALDCAPQAVRFTFGPYGKPEVAEPGDPPLAFNLSHAGDLVLVATARRPVGVDVERRASLAAETFGSIAEWTRMEAYVKALGSGIGAAEQPFDASAWSLVTLDVGPDYEAALVAAGHDWHARSHVVTPEAALPAA